MKKLMFAAVLAAVGAGCTSVQVTREGGYNDAQLKMEDSSSAPYHIDWDVSKQRVNAEGVSTCWFWFFSSSDGMNYAAPGFTFDSGVAAAKNSATYHAVENAKSDALLGCMYRITKTSKWLGIYKETKAEVKGFPAKVKSIDLVKDIPYVLDKDQQIVRLAPWENFGGKSNAASPAGAPGKKRGFWSFLGF